MGDASVDQTLITFLATMLVAVLTWVGNKAIAKLLWVDKKVRILLAFARGEHVDATDLKE